MVVLRTTQGRTTAAATGDEGDKIWLDAVWEISVIVLAAAITGTATVIVAMIYASGGQSKGKGRGARKSVTFKVTHKQAWLGSDAAFIAH